MRFFWFDRAILRPIDRLKKFLLGIGLGLQIISIFYLSSLLLYPNYSPIYLFSLNPVEVVFLFTIGCGSLSVIIGEVKS